MNKFLLNWFVMNGCTITVQTVQGCTVGGEKIPGWSYLTIKNDRCQWFAEINGSIIESLEKIKQHIGN